MSIHTDRKRAAREARETTDRYLFGERAQTVFSSIGHGKTVNVSSDRPWAARVDGSLLTTRSGAVRTFGRLESCRNAIQAALEERNGRTVITNEGDPEEWAGTFEEFVEANAETMDAEEIAAIAAALFGSRGIYQDGGGAAAAWTVTVPDLP